ncbi:MAG: AAA family ATPase, partial [Acidimicrobiales bacterium]
TATVVFTGLVGASALRARLGEEPADVLQRVHDRILRAQVEGCGGEVLKTQDDGVVAAFPAASDALTATVQIQQAIVRYNRRPDALAELSVRIGVSTGDVAWEDGDCFGSPLVEAARLKAAAAAGQILCSEFVRMMARGRGGHELSAVGFLDLKGLPEPLAACEVVWAPAPDVTFALPPEIDTGPARPFVSRGLELELAGAVVADAERTRAAVLWILGEPGIGKTRLAAEIARRAQGDGAVVLFGRCKEDLTLPYQPFLEALRSFAAQVPDEELADRLGAAPDELIRLLPELAPRLRHRNDARTSSPEAEQYRLFEAVRSWLAAAGGAHPVVVVIDDLHWA